MSNPFNQKYRPCPACTFPLAECLIGKEKDKNGVLKEIIRTYCTNNKCEYEKIRRRKAKWQ